MPHRYFILGNFTFDAMRRVLSRNGEPIALTPKAQELLRYFLERPQQLVTKDDLANEVWPNSDLTDANISQHIAMLRKALHDPLRTGPVIVTKRGVGFELAASVYATDGLPPRSVEEFTSDDDDHADCEAAYAVLAPIAEFLGLCGKRNKQEI